MAKKSKRGAVGGDPSMNAFMGKGGRVSGRKSKRSSKRK